MLRDLGVEARRTIQSRAGGKEGADVAVEGYHIEAKTGACPNLWAAMAQATADAAGSGRVPVVVAHREAPAFERAAEVMVLPLDVGLGMLAACIRAAKGEE